MWFACFVVPGGQRLSLSVKGFERQEMTKIISDEEIFDVKYPYLPHLVNKSLWVTDRDRAIARAQRDSSDAGQFIGLEAQAGVISEALLSR